jgi:HKD family nuclease
VARMDRGLYETLITEALDAQLSELGDELSVGRSGLHRAEAADRIAFHLSRVLERATATIDEEHRVAAGTALAREIVRMIVHKTPTQELAPEAPVEPGEVLRSVLGKLPDGGTELIREPLIPLLDTALLTNAPGEPRVGQQVSAEIRSADRIDVVMAFIRRSGIAPMLEALRAHRASGKELRFVTTTYTGSTEARALDALQEAGADVRVSYDSSGTRLHAKAWLFHRRSGFSTAYIGSSNLTHSALVSGLEWNVRVSRVRNPSVIDKVSAVFESYWNGGDFVPYARDEFLARAGERRGASRASS